MQGWRDACPTRFPAHAPSLACAACPQVRALERPDQGRLPEMHGCPEGLQRLVWACTHFNRRNRRVMRLCCVSSWGMHLSGGPLLPGLSVCLRNNSVPDVVPCLLRPLCRPTAAELVRSLETLLATEH